MNEKDPCSLNLTEPFIHSFTQRPECVEGFTERTVSLKEFTQCIHSISFHRTQNTGYLGRANANGHRNVRNKEYYGARWRLLRAAARAAEAAGAVRLSIRHCGQVGSFLASCAHVCWVIQAGWGGRGHGAALLNPAECQPPAEGKECARARMGARGDDVCFARDHAVRRRMTRRLPRVVVPLSCLPHRGPPW